MKLSHFFLLALIGAFFTVVSCNSKKEEPVSTDQTTLSPTDGVPQLSAEPEMLSPGDGANGEFHFKCPKNCEGGGASAKGNCPICGTELVHNQAFHAQAGAPGSSPESPIQIDPTTTTTTPGSATPPVTMPVEPPQNARGDWHYVCTKNCGGGGGAAGNCPKCGAALAHSSTYHQK